MQFQFPEVLLIIVGSTTIVIALIVLLVYSVSIHQRRNFRYQQSMLSMQIETQQQTFKNISRELHDNVGALLSMAISYLRSKDDSSTPHRNSETITDLLEEAVEILRDITLSIDPEKLKKKDLRSLIHEDLEKVTKATNCAVHFSHHGEELLFYPIVKLILYRIVQESLNNIVKHASATTIHVDLQFLPDFLKLVIRDDGKGFDVRQLLARGLSDKNGLKNIIDRSKMIGARLDIVSEPGSTSITFVYEHKNNVSLPELKNYM
jgi:signal transduction histidine kinase